MNKKQIFEKLKNIVELSEYSSKALHEIFAHIDEVDSEALAPILFKLKQVAVIPAIIANNAEEIEFELKKNDG